MLSGLSESCYREIWEAPEGNDYAVQFRRENERDWCYIEFAISQRTSLQIFGESVKNGMTSAEYRVVRLSRYPPCSVTAVIKYHKESQ